MNSYTIIKKGTSIQHCIDIPPEFLDQDLEIIIRPVKKESDFKKKLALVLETYKGTKPFESIMDPVKWQKEQRSEW